MFFEAINSWATSMCSIYKDNFTLQCLHAHIRWESTHIGWSRMCSIGFIFSYKITVRVTYSGVFKGRQARHLPRAPLKYTLRKYSSFLVKTLLSSHIISSESHHTRNSVLCLQRGPQEQLKCVSKLLCFQRAPNNNCNVQVLYFMRVPNSNCFV